MASKCWRDKRNARPLNDWRGDMIEQDFEKAVAVQDRDVLGSSDADLNGRPVKGDGRID